MKFLVTRVIVGSGSTPLLIKPWRLGTYDRMVINLNSSMAQSLRITGAGEPSPFTHILNVSSRPCTLPAQTHIIVHGLLVIFPSAEAPHLQEPTGQCKAYAQNTGGNHSPLLAIAIFQTNSRSYYVRLRPAL
jgi:hypothetical protein